MLFHVTIDQDEDGWLVAQCLALPGCASQGKTEQEALQNMKEAIQAWRWAEDQKAFLNQDKTRPQTCGFGLMGRLSNISSKPAVKAFPRLDGLRSVLAF